MGHDVITPLFVFLFCLARIMAIFRTAPFMGGNALPGGVRNAVAMTMVILVYPMVLAEVPEGITLSIHLGMLMGKEILIGVIIGYLLGLLFWTAESVGFLIDNQRGASMASSMDPLSGDQSSPLGSLFFQTVVMLFFLSGAFIAFIGFLMHSYAAWPVFSFLPNLSSNTLSDMFITQLNVFARTVLALSGPILILCFLTDLGLGLINRFAPQLNVFFLSMPIKSGLAMFFLILYVGVLMHIFKDKIDSMQQLYKFLQEAFQ
ncbi:type III secretion system export apparatus subunit SctT [Halodesulfovibrio sp.]|uniref:type III secretion system export apparatus subunit SctT n=1 Tax=Halodesulfovibrio sp. TaxID=1912772 RepID=UPI0025B7F4C2|nr:type III secretion system export apparatus subunit SctT [Halodesulfovibrio sp.]